jgi:hypothetical protein
MSDRMGVLGEATATAVATATIYTCPAGKAAKGKFMLRFQGDTNTVVALLVNGIEVARNTAMTTAHYNYTIKGGGMFAYASGSATPPTGLANALTVAPADPIYYLNTGDTVQYTVLTAALLAANFQFVGVEIDV